MHYMHPHSHCLFTCQRNPVSIASFVYVHTLPEQYANAVWSAHKPGSVVRVCLLELLLNLATIHP